MSEELRIWRVSSAREVEPLSPFSEMPSEWEFEELLVGNPELLERGLRLVGRQTRTRTGWLDLLAVDADGRLVVFELKRGTLAREAVTQVLDYASDLDAMDSSELAEHIADRSGTGGVQRIEDFEQWYAAKFRHSPTVAERRRALREYLADKGYADLFDRIREDIRERLPERGVWVETGRYGVSFQLAEPDNRQLWKTYFGLQAGYITSEVNIYSVSILPQAIHWGGDALDRLREAVSLYDWTHGGQFLRFKSADEWDQVRSAVLEFVDAVVANRAGRADLGAH